MCTVILKGPVARKLPFEEWFRGPRPGSEASHLSEFLNSVPGEVGLSSRKGWCSLSYLKSTSPRHAVKSPALGTAAATLRLLLKINNIVIIVCTDLSYWATLTCGLLHGRWFHRYVVTRCPDIRVSFKRLVRSIPKASCPLFSLLFLLGKQPFLLWSFS